MTTVKPGDIIYPIVSETENGNVRVQYGDVLVMVYTPENAGKFARELEDAVREIEWRRQQLLPMKSIAALHEGNPMQKNKELA